MLDFGSQYALLIARRVRDARVYAEVVPHTITPEEVRARGARGLILSGGPASVYAEGAPRCDPALLRMFPNRLEHDPSDLHTGREHASREDVVPIGLFYREENAGRYDDFSRVGLDLPAEAKLKAIRAELGRFAV